MPCSKKTHPSGASSWHGGEEHGNTELTSAGDDYELLMGGLL